MPSLSESESERERERGISVSYSRETHSFDKHTITQLDLTHPQRQLGRDHQSQSKAL